MSGDMLFRLGGVVAGTGGVLGVMTGLVMEPAAYTVTNLIVEPGRRRGNPRLVPLDLVDSTATGIRLRCSMEDFEALESAIAS